MLILDRQLRPLMATTIDDKAWFSDLVLWQPDADTQLLLRPGCRTPTLALIKVPFAWQRLLPYAIVAGVALMAVAVMLILRRPHRIDSHHLRETRLSLMDNLELSSHGAIAPLKCVRRLVWHLRALQTDLGANDKVDIRMREAWTECRESALPHLKGILDRTQLAALSADNIRIAALATTEIEQLLADLAQDNFQATAQPDIAERLATAEHQADVALIRLRAEVATHFHADVAQIVARVRAANDLALSQAGIAFQAGYAVQTDGHDTMSAERPAAVTGLCDTRELEFVLDNLVGNAITAMAASARRQLHVTWRTTDGMVLIDVSDTGCGLDEEDWSRVLNTRYSSKTAGGQGLPTSNKYLRKYGGTLAILRSAPGQGTTIRVTLPES